MKKAIKPFSKSKTIIPAPTPSYSQRSTWSRSVCTPSIIYFQQLIYSPKATGYILFLLISHINKQKQTFFSIGRIERKESLRWFRAIYIQPSIICRFQVQVVNQPQVKNIWGKKLQKVPKSKTWICHRIIHGVSKSQTQLSD